MKVKNYCTYCSSFVELGIATAMAKLCIHAKVTFAVTGALVGYATYWLYKKLAPRYRAAKSKGKDTGNLYETDELLNQYLSFHFGEAEDIGLSKIGCVPGLAKMIPMLPCV
jgi:hypothetical protein